MDVVLCRGVGMAGGRLAGYFGKNQRRGHGTRVGAALTLCCQMLSRKHVEHDALTHKHSPVLISQRAHCLQANAPLCCGGPSLLRHFLT